MKVGKKNTPLDPLFFSVQLTPFFLYIYILFLILLAFIFICFSFLYKLSTGFYSDILILILIILIFIFYFFFDMFIRAISSEETEQCQLLGPLALFIQALMGIFAVLSLIYKRQREFPQRPWRIWTFDVSKQLLGALSLHFINLILSSYHELPKKPNPDDNPCTWYFINLLLDTTIGVFVLWVFLYMIHMTAFRIGITGIISGQYGSPPRFSNFVKQSLLYLLGLCCMKSVLYSLLEMGEKWWVRLGGLLLAWTNWSAELKVVFVIFIFPVVMNTLQYYLIDTIIQSPEYHSYEELSSDSIESTESREIIDPEQGLDYPIESTITRRNHHFHDGYDFLGQRESVSISRLKAGPDLHAYETK